ncbi:MAG TPA: transporter substrate-binding domain-containing protein [Geminicoccaceae bacterium]|nr:transporter substrate-binding domain-containing protein [Geminicoccaceae bacterium]
MRWMIAACMLWVAVAPLQARAAQPCTLRVGWEPYAPFTFAGEDGEATGADIDLIKAIADEIGCAVETVELPWARIVKEVEQGTLDVSTSTSRTPERDQWALFSQPYRETEVAIYVRRGEVPRFALRELADVPAQRLRLGVIVDYYYGKALADAEADPAFAAWVDGAPDYATNIRKLVSDRIDGFLVEDVAVMQAEVERMGESERVERYPLRIPGEKLRFMFSRKTVDPALVAKVDAVVAQMRADGRLDAIRAKYLR